MAASYAAKTLQSLLIGYLLSIMHARTRVFRRQTGAKQWSIDWLIGCMVAVVTQYCSCFGGIIGKSSPSFVRALCQPCRSLPAPIPAHQCSDQHLKHLHRALLLKQQCWAVCTDDSHGRYCCGYCPMTFSSMTGAAIKVASGAKSYWHDAEACCR